MGTPKASNEWRQPPGPSLKSTALAHPPLRWGDPRPRRGRAPGGLLQRPSPANRLCPGPECRLRGGRGAARRNRGPGPRVPGPGASQLPWGHPGASLQLPALPRNPQASLAGDVPLWSCPSLPVCPCPRPLFLCVSASPLLGGRRLNSGLRVHPYVLGDPSLMMFAKT